VLELTLEKSVSHSVSLTYETYSESSDENSAQVGADYQYSSGVINVNTSYGSAGDPLSTTTIPLHTYAQDLVQNDRTFYFKILDVYGARVDSDIITITMTDEAENVTYAFDNEYTQASYQAGNISVNLTKSVASNNELVVPFDISGTANEGFDYKLINDSNEVVFAAGETTANINIQVIDNGLPRSGSTINLTLKNAGTAETGDISSHNIILLGNMALNDTGALTGDDAKYGRDSESSNDNTDGLARFSYTKLDYNGNKLSDNSSIFTCIEDNVTGLVYEKKQASIMVYNAKLSDDEIIRLGKSLSLVTLQNIYDTFPEKDGDRSDFTYITGIEWDGLSTEEKKQLAFTDLMYVSDNEFEAFLIESPRVTGDAVTYPFNSSLEYLHNGWRNNENSYYWLDQNTKTNGGRAGSVGSFINNNVPISRFCAFPHEDMSSYVSGLQGCNSRDYLIAMNELAVCGFTDWRLPTVEELRSVVNYDINSPRWDNSFFPQSNSYGDYLSATPSVNNNASAWCVSGSSGELKLCHKQLPNLIRAARGSN